MRLPSLLPLRPLIPAILAVAVACGPPADPAEAPGDVPVSPGDATGVAGAGGTDVADGGPAGRALGDSRSGSADAGSPPARLDAGAEAGTDAGSPAAADAVEPPPPDPTAALFPSGRVLDVQITMAPADWDALRLQTRSLLDVLGPGCLDAPAGSPFTWFPASVTVDGEVLEQVGLRKKGLLGSMSAVKPSLRVDFDRFVDGQLLHGATSMTLNNCRQDPSLVRQCLSYAVFRAAGVPAPRCAFARVAVNGLPLGLYAQVEPIKKAFLHRWFAQDGGDLWEGTLSDFRPEWLGTFEKKNHEGKPDHVSLAAVAAALEAPDEELSAALAPTVDVDAFLTFWAAEVVLGHWDGYAGNANNFYLYADPADGSRLRFLPWGVDATLQPGPSPFPASVMATGILARRLYQHPSFRKKYVARLKTVLATAWDEAVLLSELERLEALLSPLATDPGFAEAVAGVRQFIAGRRVAIEGQLEGGPPPWNVPLRGDPCAKEAGTVTAEVETTWGTLGAPNPFDAGSGSFDLVLGGKAFPAALVGVRAGIVVEGEAPGQAELDVFAKTNGSDVRVLILSLPPATLAAGAALPVDPGGVEAVIYGFQMGSDAPPQLIGIPGNGTLLLQSFGDTPGAPVKASLTATVYGWY